MDPSKGLNTLPPLKTGDGERPKSIPATQKQWFNIDQYDVDQQATGSSDPFEIKLVRLGSKNKEPLITKSDKAITSTHKKILKREEKFIDLLTYKESKFGSIIHAVAKIGINVLMWPLTVCSLGLYYPILITCHESLEEDRCKLLSCDDQRFEFFSHLDWGKKEEAKRALEEEEHRSFIASLCKSVTFISWLVVFNKEAIVTFLHENDLLNQEMYNVIQSTIQDPVHWDFFVQEKLRIMFWADPDSIESPGCCPCACPSFGYNRYHTVRGWLPEIIENLIESEKLVAYLCDDINYED